MNHDLQIALDSAIGTFVGLLFMETLVKPIAIYVGKFILRKVDQKVLWIPDFLYKKDDG